MSEEALRDLKPSELKRRAREAGVDDDAMDEAADAADPKEALIALVLAATGEAVVEAEAEPATEGEMEMGGLLDADAADEDAPEAEPAAGAEAEPVAEGEMEVGGLLDADADGEDVPEAEPAAGGETTLVAGSEQDSAESRGDNAVDAAPEAASAADSEQDADDSPGAEVAGDDVPEGVPPSDGGLTKVFLMQLGSSIGWDEDMVDGTLSAMDGDLEQCAALLREQGATAEPAAESEQATESQPDRESEPEPEPEQEQPVDEQEQPPSAASEDAELDTAKNALFAGAAPKKKKTGDDAALDAAKGSLFAGAKPSKKAASTDEDEALAEAKGALFGGAKSSGGASKKPKTKAKGAAQPAGTGLGLARDSNEPEDEAPVRSLDDLDAGDMSMMTIDEELTIPQARQESGKTYYQILWTEQGGGDHDVWRRYSEFDSLRKKISGKKGGHPEIKTLHFPGKTKLKSKGNSENVVDDRQGHLQAWLQQLVMAKQVVPDSEGDNAQKMLYDFLSGDSEPEFHRMMTNGVPEEGSMKAVGHYE